jgi:hypothetical protein
MVGLTLAWCAVRNADPAVANPCRPRRRRRAHGACAAQTCGGQHKVTSPGSAKRVNTALVSDGIFRQVRNPTFTAMVAAQAGTVSMAPTWLSLAGLAVLVPRRQLQVRRVEEPYLYATHGQEPSTSARAWQMRAHLKHLTALRSPCQPAQTWHSSRLEHDHRDLSGPARRWYCSHHGYAARPRAI